ncbi:Rieske (2Fe-2S) protein [Amycolatopsis jejuensis]|uniref:Rieske (2Fe-2S) protein n=1 Tax=Amycolatopsis jejuensis TaxID=330084 RepID=UPI000525CA01|nr:Rieske (2Fe-2S) protein [Amycolatopsis jejuensis]
MAEILVGDLAVLTGGRRIFVSAGEREIGVLAHRGTVMAFENRCLHQGGPVCEGVINGRVEAILGEDRSVLGERFSDSVFHLACPWHGWEYEFPTGKSVTEPGAALRVFETVVRDGEVYVVVEDD